MPKFQPASQDNGKFETIYSLKLNEKMAAAYKRLERSERDDLAEALRREFARFLHGCTFNPHEWL